MLSNKAKRRIKIKKSIKAKVFGTPDRPRLSVFRSNKEIYAQIIDDVNGNTLAAASSKDKTIASTKAPKIDIAKKVGELIAKNASGAGVASVIFDRNGYLYHGRVKALAEGAREGGMKF